MNGVDVEKLERLGAMVDEVAGPDPEQVHQEQQQQAQQASDETAAQAWGQLPFFIGSALGMFVPAVQAIYTEEKCLNWGRSMVPVANKYGWNVTSNVPEVGLALSTLAMVFPTVLLVRAQLAMLNAGQEAARGGVMGALASWWAARKQRKAAEAMQAAGAGGTDPAGVPGGV